MKYAFVADVHVGNHAQFGGEVRCSMNQRCRDVLDVLGKARAKSGPLFYVLGDLMDSSHPKPQMLYEVSLLLKDAALIVGNHERVSMQIGDHCLSILETDFIDVFDVAQVYSPVACIPHYKVASQLQYISKCLEEKKERIDILALHVGLVDETFPEFLRDPASSVDVYELAALCKKHGIKAVFSGDYHRRYYWEIDGVKILQVGALCPTGFRDSGDNYGTLAFWDTETEKISWETIPGPRFYVHQLGEQMQFDRKNINYLLLKCKPEETDKAIETLEKCKEWTVRDGRVWVEQGNDIPAMAGLPDSTTIEQAVEEYVDTMPLTEDMSINVLQRCKRYL